MPGSVGATTGYVDRRLGKTVGPASELSRMGKGGALIASGGNIFCQASSGGVGNGADATEDVLMQVVLPPGTFDINARQILIEAYGSIAATSATKDAKIYFGTAQLAGSAFHATTTQTGNWVISALITRSGVGTQTALVMTDTTLPAAGVTVHTQTVQSLTQDETVALTIKVTGQAPSTANLVLCNMLSVGGYN
jgi:hypothetical protein